jgi:phosphohistidine phosphatase
MVVGHNPGMTAFANFLVPGITNNLPTAGVVSVQIEADDWSFYRQPDCKLIAHDYPKLGR